MGFRWVMIAFPAVRTRTQRSGTRNRTRLHLGDSATEQERAGVRVPAKRLSRSTRKKHRKLLCFHSKLALPSVRMTKPHGYHRLLLGGGCHDVGPIGAGTDVLPRHCGSDVGEDGGGILSANLELIDQTPAETRRLNTE